MVTVGKLPEIQFVLNAEGKEVAVQIGIQDWKRLINYLEELEDRAVLRQKLTHLRMGPEQSGALPWQDIQGQW